MFAGHDYGLVVLPIALGVQLNAVMEQITMLMGLQTILKTLDVLMPQIIASN